LGNKPPKFCEKRGVFRRPRSAIYVFTIPILAFILRTKAAEGVGAIEEKAEEVLDRGADALHRVDDFLQDTKEHVSEALRAGQEAIRPAPAARKG
jgi:hypothetical protein